MAEVTKAMAFALEKAEFWDLLWAEEYPPELSAGEQDSLSRHADQFSSVIATILLACVNAMRTELGQEFADIPKPRTMAAAQNHSVKLSMYPIDTVRDFLYSLQFSVNIHRSDNRVRLRLILDTKKRRQAELIKRLRKAGYENVVVDGYWVLVHSVELREGDTDRTLSEEFGRLSSRVIGALRA